MFPLEGLRVADFTWAWAGPVATTVLADMGAEVINIEAVPPRMSNLRAQAPFSSGVPGGWNRSGWWSSNQRNKLSVTIDLTRPEGVALAKRLVAISDVAAENFSSRVMHKLGLDYQALREVKPDLAYLSMSGYGSYGPKRDYLGFGPHWAMNSGLVHVTGFPDRPPAQIMIPYGDPNAGVTGAFAVLSALYHRFCTGQGQWIDLSQTEALVCHLPEPLLDWFMNGRVQEREGNGHPFMAPHGCYPCKGDQAWVTIAVGGDDEWDSLCRALGNPEWSRDTRFGDAYGRWRHRDEVDRRLADWTREHSPYEVMHSLQAVGVAAAPSLSNRDLLADPHLQARGFWVEDKAPQAGPKLMAGPAWRMSETTRSEPRHAPSLGEHNEYVFVELLGLSPREFRQFVEKGVIPQGS